MMAKVWVRHGSVKQTHYDSLFFDSEFGIGLFLHTSILIRVRVRVRVPVRVRVRVRVS